MISQYDRKDAQGKKSISFLNIFIMKRRAETAFVRLLN